MKWKTEKILREYKKNAKLFLKGFNEMKERPRLAHIIGFSVHKYETLLSKYERKLLRRGYTKQELDLILQLSERESYCRMFSKFIIEIDMDADEEFFHRFTDLCDDYYIKWEKVE